MRFTKQAVLEQISSVIYGWLTISTLVCTMAAVIYAVYRNQAPSAASISLAPSIALLVGGITMLCLLAERRAVNSPRPGSPQQWRRDNFRYRWRVVAAAGGLAALGAAGIGDSLSRLSSPLTGSRPLTNVKTDFSTLPQIVNAPDALVALVAQESSGLCTMLFISIGSGYLGAALVIYWLFFRFDFRSFGSGSAV